MIRPSLASLAERLAPPCRLARRYDRCQRLRALNVLYDTMREVAQELGVTPDRVRAGDLIRLDLVDDIAFALGLWRSPSD